MKLYHYFDAGVCHLLIEAIALWDVAGRRRRSMF